MTANDMRTLLRRDHDEIVQLARDMCESESGDERRALLKQLKPSLFAHTRAEQREVYDVLLRRQGDDDAREIAYEGYVAHSVLDDLLERMTKSRKTESDEWKAHSQVLLELITQHVEKEQQRLFDFLTAQYNDDEREAIYRRLFNEFAAGRHPSAVGEQAWQAFLPSGGNLAKRVSQSRELHFRTGQDWHAYHEKYGRGTILEAVASAAQLNGRAVALMETFGTNPREMLTRFMNEADDRAAAIGAATSEQRNRFSLTDEDVATLLYFRDDTASALATSTASVDWAAPAEDDDQTGRRGLFTPRQVVATAIPDLTNPARAGQHE